MALTIEVTKVSVSCQMPNLWNIRLKLRCLEDLVDVIDKDFSISYAQGQNIQGKVSEIQQQMQDAINDYKAEQQIFNHTQLDAAVTNIQTNLEG